MADADETRVSLKIDVRNGTIELNAPAGSFEHAIQKTKELTSTLDLRGSGAQLETPGVVGGRASSSDASSKVAQDSSKAAQEKTRGKSGKSTSGARSGRLGSFTPDQGLLSEEQQRAIREFRISKAPTDQHDEALVALYQGEKLLSRKGFSFNEIYTLMWRAGTSPLPKALDEVMRQLALQQLVERGDEGYFMKFIGQERVENDLPRKKE